MSFARGDKCYILENNIRVRRAKVISKQGKYYIIQLVGSCGAIRLLENRLFKTKTDAENSKKRYTNNRNQITPSKYIDIFEGGSNKNPYN